MEQTSEGSEATTARRRTPDVACQDCILRRSRIFKPLDDAELSYVAKLKDRQILRPAGARLLGAGPAGGFIYTLHAGWAFRSIRLNDGSRQIVEFLLPGDVFGLHVAMLGNWDYDVTALTPVVLCRLKAPSLDELCTRFPSLNRALIHTLAEDKRRADSRLAVLGRTLGPQRIAYLMLELAERLEEAGELQEDCCDFPLRRRHLADATGLSGTHVNRSLAELRERRLAHVEGGRLTILDRDQLIGFAGYSSLAQRIQRLIL
ncbi:Crp/Fnr family transcriptional regulator [Azospirillum sp.]|uniref:Crp/Fnr family transcriptional regulator n=1 Tax=Azospirillum sp. TaxID=34012 RepID=UPI003D76482F